MANTLRDELSDCIFNKCMLYLRNEYDDINLAKDMASEMTQHILDSMDFDSCDEHTEIILQIAEEEVLASYKNHRTDEELKQEAIKNFKG